MSQVDPSNHIMMCMPSNHIMMCMQDMNDVPEGKMSIKEVSSQDVRRLIHHIMNDVPEGKMSGH
eukprot:scaffold8514_cov74-Skeletonema_dohrnii-CCMP3373.AAC.6